MSIKVPQAMFIPNMAAFNGRLDAILNYNAINSFPRGVNINGSLHFGNAWDKFLTPPRLFEINGDGYPQMKIANALWPNKVQLTGVPQHVKAVLEKHEDPIERAVNVISSVHVERNLWSDEALTLIYRAASQHVKRAEAEPDPLNAAYGFLTSSLLYAFAIEVGGLKEITPDMQKSVHKFAEAGAFLMAAMLKEVDAFYEIQSEDDINSLGYEKRKKLKGNCLEASNLWMKVLEDKSVDLHTKMLAINRGLWLAEYGDADIDTMLRYFYELDEMVQIDFKHSVVVNGGINAVRLAKRMVYDRTPTLSEWMKTGLSLEAAVMGGQGVNKGTSQDEIRTLAASARAFGMLRSFEPKEGVFLGFLNYKHANVDMSMFKEIDFFEASILSVQRYLEIVHPEEGREKWLRMSADSKGDLIMRILFDLYGKSGEASLFAKKGALFVSRKYLERVSKATIGA